MIMTLMSPAGRFRDLKHKLAKLRERKAAMAAAMILFLIPMSFAQEGHEGHNHAPGEHPEMTSPKKKDATFKIVSEDHSDALAKMPVQDNKGRVVPFHTLSDQILRKVSRQQKFNDLNAVQVILSMHMYPDYWMNQPMIYTSTVLLDTLGLTENRCSYLDLISDAGEFKLAAAYEDAFAAKESKRNEFKKQLIKLTDRFQVMNQVFGWQYMKVVPMSNDMNGT